MRVTFWVARSQLGRRAPPQLCETCITRRYHLALATICLGVPVTVLYMYTNVTSAGASNNRLKHTSVKIP
jgi:hypothetical protein